MKLFYTTFGESQEPKPKNWRRKTFECSCNIGISHNKEDLGRIDIKYIVKSKHEEIVTQGGYNKTRWWSRRKPNNWEITHIEQKFDNIKHTISTSNRIDISNHIDIKSRKLTYSFNREKFYEHFYSKKELRKLKLNKIQKNV